MAVWPIIERFVAEHGGAVLVTLADVQGSSPREVGARMVVRPDGGFHGTIGGGTLEWIALAEAQAMLANNQGVPFKQLDKALGPDLGQCCGGRVKVTLERFDKADVIEISVFAAVERTGELMTVSAATTDRPSRDIVKSLHGTVGQEAYARLPDGRVVEKFGSNTTPLYLFGAGHVGRSLAVALAPLPFTVTWIDTRPNAFPPHVPSNATCVSDVEPANLIASAPVGAFVAIMTHSHALDLDIAAAALKARCFPYIGVIGSETKRARFVSTLRKLGVAQSDIERLICPIGLTEIQDKAPAAIAASIVAQLLIARDNASAASVPASETGQATVDRVRHG
ncbi:MAG: xanthine dehydrogenase accessory protein XdhC [Xanthobacteraceae bacterium]